jgi:nitroimidazol reductase NimA-like FMN-containing flavoprotein (pyridoxamine 5'-phosphate oxidase superfamily)
MSGAQRAASRVSVHRHPERGRADRADIDPILDEALICHIGFVEGGQPFVIPTIHARDGDHLYVHGSTASRMIRVLKTGTPACLTATILDGLVLARSVFNHSMNYRSVVVLGSFEEVVDPEAKLAALRTVSEHILPGRWNEVRSPTELELKATAVLRLDLAEASAKTRTGPPKDDPSDLVWPVWAGVVALGTTAIELRPDPELLDGLATPDETVLRRRLGGPPS